MSTVEAAETFKVPPEAVGYTDIPTVAVEVVWITATATLGTRFNLTVWVEGEERASVRRILSKVEP